MVFTSGHSEHVRIFEKIESKIGKMGKFINTQVNGIEEEEFRDGDALLIRRSQGGGPLIDIGAHMLDSAYTFLIIRKFPMSVRQAATGSEKDVESSVLWADGIPNVSR